MSSSLESQLEAAGALEGVRAMLRTQVLQAMTSQQREAPPKMPEDVYVMNELVREFLVYYGYSETASVLQLESGIATQRMPRQVLSQEVNVSETETTRQLPLLQIMLQILRRTT
eukprot:m.198854 g.198854  ORF g.198854 m.198854 type:complete len:114 (+) comp14927_c0_seq7:1631-1972(+)